MFADNLNVSLCKVSLKIYRKSSLEETMAACSACSVNVEFSEVETS